MNNKTIASLLILQLLAFPCMATGDGEQEENPSVQVQAEQIENNNVTPSIFSNDEASVIFTPRALYQAVRNGDQRAKNLLEYLGECFNYTIHALYQIEDETFSIESSNLDREYTLPVEHFTQKMLDEPLWGIDIEASGLDKLFPRPIFEGATYEAIQALAKAIGIENVEPYFSENDGQVILAKMVMDAAKLLEEKTNTLQVIESEKAEFEKMIPQMESTVNEVRAKIEQLQSENSQLMSTLQEKEVAFQDLFQREADIRAVKEALEVQLTDNEAKLADVESKHSLLQNEHTETLSALEIAQIELNKSTQKNVTYDGMVKQALSALTFPQND